MGEIASARGQGTVQWVDYEAGMAALPTDFRSCRGPVCGNGPPSGAVWLSNTGAPAASFVHVVDCRPGEPHRVAAAGVCTDERRGNLYLQYWLYYEDSSSLKLLQPALDASRPSTHGRSTAVPSTRTIGGALNTCIGRSTQNA